MGAMHACYDILLSLCVNFSNISNYAGLVQRCFDEFDKSCVSDYFQQILFQYTMNANSIWKMFEETEDTLKY